MSKWAKTNMACPCGKSSDAYAEDKKGNGFCFSCGIPFFDKKEREDGDESIEVSYIAHRGLTQESLRKYNILVGRDKETKNLLYSVALYPTGGLKYRNLIDKGFRTEGDMGAPQLFGMDKFNSGELDTVTITEGELDAASVWQMVNMGTAAVSVRSSVTALKDCKSHWKWLNGFKKIVICMDNDIPGNEAAKKIAGLFDFSKVFKVSLQEYKDANDYLVNDRKNAFFKEWLAAKKYTPDEILSTFAEFEKALEQPKEAKIGEYPTDKLNAMLKGIHSGEIIVVKGMEGTGKTEFFRFMQDHLLKTTTLPLGVIHLEENTDTTLSGFACYHLEEAIDLDDGIHTNKDVLNAFKDAVGGDEGRVMIYDSFDQMDDDEVFLDNLRFLVTVGGCKVVFLDHISWLATGNDLNEDERKKLDRITQRLKMMTKELGFCLIMISHVNDDGKTRGSRNITKVANTVIDITRNVTTSDPVERNKTHLTIEKARRRGSQSGQAGFLISDPETTILKDGLKLSLF